MFISLCYSKWESIKIKDHFVLEFEHFYKSVIMYVKNFKIFCNSTCFVFNTMVTSKLLCCFTNCYSTQLLCSFDPNPRRKDCSRKTYLFPTCEFKRKSVQKDLEKRFAEATTYNFIIYQHPYLFLVFYLCFFSKLISLYVSFILFFQDLHFLSISTSF